MNETYQHLWDDSKEYLQLRYQLLKTELVKNLGKLIGLAALLLLGALTGAGILLYLGAALATAIAPYTGGMAIALCITAGVLALTVWLLFALRKPLFIGPVTRAVARILSLDRRLLADKAQAGLESDIERQQKVVEAQGQLCKIRIQTQLQQGTARMGWTILLSLIKRLLFR